MTNVETISIVIAAVSVVIGVINSIRSSQKAEEQRQTEIETRQAELFSNIYSRWTDPEFAKHYGAARWHLPSDPEKIRERGLETWDPDAFASYHVLFTFFEGLGVFVKKGLIDMEYIDDLFSRRIIQLWEQFEPWIVHRRREMENPDYVDSWEYLYNLMKQREQQATAIT